MLDFTVEYQGPPFGVARSLVDGPTPQPLLLRWESYLMILLRRATTSQVSLLTRVRVRSG